MGLNIDELVAETDGKVIGIEVKPSSSKPLGLRWPFFRGQRKVLRYDEVMEYSGLTVARKFQGAVVVEYSTKNGHTPLVNVLLKVYV